MRSRPQQMPQDPQAEKPAVSVAQSTCDQPGTPISDTPRMITQLELTRFQDLEPSDKAYDKIRRRLIAAIKRGAPIESGLLTARIARGSQKTASREKLEAILGPLLTAFVFEQLELTSQERLIISCPKIAARSKRYGSTPESTSKNPFVFTVYRIKDPAI